MRKILKGAGASALAAATVMTGLSFGPAALAAPVPAPAAALAPQASTSSIPADGTEFYLIAEKADGTFWGQVSKTGTALTTYKTRAAAEAKSSTWKVVANGDTFLAENVDGPVPGACLLASRGTANPALPYAWWSIPAKGEACDTSDTKLQWRIDEEGRVVSEHENAYISSGALYGGTIALALRTTGPALTFQANAGPFDAQVGTVDTAKRTAEFSGTAPKDSTVRIDGGDDIAVGSDGKWSATVEGLKIGENTVHVENWRGASKLAEKDVSVTLTVANLTGRALAPEKNTDNVLVNGQGEPGAEITIANAQGAVLATTTVNSVGGYFATIPAPNAGGVHAFTATQKVGGADAGSVDFDFNYGAAVTVTSPADDAVHPGGQLGFTGRGEAGGTVTLREEGDTADLGTATVQANGNWIITGVTLDALEHKLVVSQLAKGNNTTTAKLTLNPGVEHVIVSPTVESPEAGSTVEVSRPTFTGHGEPDSKLTIGYGKNLIGTTTVRADGTWTLNPSSGLALGKSDLVVTQTSGADVKTIDYTLNRVVVEQPFAITSHDNNQSYTDGVAKFRGTSASGASIKAVNQWGTVMGTTTADANGNWGFDRNLGPTTDGYDITFTATKAGVTETQKLHLKYQSAIAFEITSPANGSVYKAGNTTFIGKAAPGTTIRATNQWGTLMGATTSNVDGKWSFVRNLGPTTAGYDITFVATKGDDTQRTVLHLDPELVNVPVTVTSIKDGDTYRPGQNVLTGTGTPGAKVSAVNATNGWNVSMGSADVDSDGTWALPSRNWGPSNDYQILVTQTNPDKTTSNVTVNVKAPVFQALKVTSPEVGDTYENYALTTFSGTATPFATVTVRSETTATTYKTVVADSNGDWSFQRAWGPDYTYKLAFDQKAPNGQTDSITGFVWAANAAK